MNDERHDDRPPRRASRSDRQPGAKRIRTDPEKPSPGRSGRPRYIAPPPVVYTPATILGIHAHTTPSIPTGARELVSMLLDVVEETSPLPASRRKDIRNDVLELWRELTSEKSSRQPDYIGEPAKLAAYLRYFLPWNVVRLIPLLSSIELELSSGDGVLDIGSGPLTLPIALWIARPELRSVPLRIDCIDRVRRVMEIGTTILEGLALRAGQALAWKLNVKKDSFSITDAASRDHYNFVTAANVFNESFWRIKGPLSERATMLATSLGAYTAPGGRILIVEPGDPRSGAMLAALREAVILGGGRPLAPCPHSAACPMAGAFLSSAFRKETTEPEPRPRAPSSPAMEKVISAKGRSKAPWCHFVLNPGAAPQKLSDFSEAAGLPKDRLIASWLLLEPDSPAVPPKTPPSAPPERSIRIVSDAFRLPDGGLGRYACSKTGYSLVRDSLADLPSCSLAILDAPIPSASSERDQKSNAVIIRARSDTIPSQTLPPKTARSAPGATPKRPDTRTQGQAGRSGRETRTERSRKPPIPPRGLRQSGKGARTEKSLGERSPYARAKKPRSPGKPKRST